MTSNQPTIYDKILGGLLGVAAGDALGATVEFTAPDAIAAQYGRHSEIIGGGAFQWRPGQGTDDTDMTACVARAYASGYTLHTVSQNFLSWLATRPRDIGATTSTALHALLAYGDPRASGVVGERSAGNGSLMRALPTALARRDQRRRCAEADEIGAITHADPRCVLACVAYVEIAAGLLDGHSVPDALAHTERCLEDRQSLHPHENQAAEVIREALHVNPARRISAMPTTGYVVDSFRAAVWAVQQDRPLEELVIDVVNRGDDADTTGAIVGGVLGVRDGAGSIPHRWLASLEYYNEFTRLATVLSQLWTGTVAPAGLAPRQ